LCIRGGGEAPAIRIHPGGWRPAAPGLVLSNLRAPRPEAGLPRIRVHDLRHTWASLALEAGVPAKVVQEILGHASVGITLDTYSHVVPAMREEAAATVAALIFPGKEVVR
jgi:integrase